ncbi:MAG: YhjD/YihY/BrkB family envelope integrity protein [Phycisphaerae bacterium]
MFWLKLKRFLTVDIWRMRLSKMPRRKSFLFRQLRTFLLSIRGFMEDQCKFRASALTYFTLLTIVPIVALLFGIAKGFGYETVLEERIRGWLYGQEDIADKIIEFANSVLSNANGGFIAGVGMIILLLAVLRLLTNVENSLNTIWGVKKPRSFARRLSDYVFLIIVGPFMMIISSSLTVLVSGRLENAAGDYPLLGFIGPLVAVVIWILPYCVIWLVFTFIYMFVPNTKVNFTSALFAGIIGGTIFQLVQWGYITFQIGAARYGAIYGSFAALPLFLLWVQLSWLVVLFGAELSFAHQNVGTYEFEPDCLETSYSFKKLISLELTHALVVDFCKAQKPRSSAEIAHKLEIPIRPVRQPFYELVKAGVLSEVKTSDGKYDAYQPAVDTSLITVEYVVRSLEESGKNDIPVAETHGLKKLSDCLSTFAREIKNSPANVLLKDIERKGKD